MTTTSTPHNLQNRKSIALAAPFLMLALVNISSCSGGGSSDAPTSRTTTLFGEVEQGDLNANLSGTPVKNLELSGVEVCVLEKCEVTNDDGEYNITVDAPPGGSVLEVRLRGRGINTELPIRVNADTISADIDFLYDPAQKLVRSVKVQLNGVLDAGQSDGSFNDGD